MKGLTEQALTGARGLVAWVSLNGWAQWRGSLPVELQSRG